QLLNVYVRNGLPSTGSAPAFRMPPVTCSNCSSRSSPFLALFAFTGALDGRAPFFGCLIGMRLSCGSKAIERYHERQRVQRGKVVTYLEVDGLFRVKRRA